LKGKRGKKGDRGGEISTQGGGRAKETCSPARRVKEFVYQEKGKKKKPTLPGGKMVSGFIWGSAMEEKSRGGFCA